LLEVSYEGTNQVKESKISMLVHEYELFLMHDNESISDMFTRFTTIINSLKNLGKSYHNQKLVRKILRCLPKIWTPKVTAIEEAKDLSTLPLEQLLGSLMTHETTIKNHEHVKAKKKKTIALKASKEDSESDATWDDSDPSSSEEEESDEEVVNLALMAMEEDASEDESDIEVQFSFDELQNAYEKLYVEYENVCLKNKSLKK
ncbi:UBN2 domain-containing protein, partial [Cephalotus follicularis]